MQARQEESVDRLEQQVRALRRVKYFRDELRRIDEARSARRDALMWSLNLAQAELETLQSHKTVRQ